MDPFSVVEEFNVTVDLVIGLLLGLKSLAVNQLLLEDAVKGFNTSIVVAVAFAAHAGCHFVNFELFSVLVGRILAPSIRMMNEPFFRPFGHIGILQSVQNKIGCHSVIQTPAHDLTGA